jgi:hypothetical protein
MLGLGAKAHDVFDAGAVVPATVEDHNFISCRKMLEIPLEEQLVLLTMGRRWQRYFPQDARADALRQSFDGPPLPAASRPSEDDHDAQPLCFIQS